VKESVTPATEKPTDGNQSGINKSNVNQSGIKDRSSRNVTKEVNESGDKGDKKESDNSKADIKSNKQITR